MSSPCHATRFHLPRLAWLLWLLVALLPLRSWADAAMWSSQVAVQASVGTPARAAAPCHETAVATALNGDETTGLQKATGSHNCSLCSICHASLGPTPCLTLARVDVPGLLPAAQPCPGLPPGVVNGLFRPPRTTPA